MALYDAMTHVMLYSRAGLCCADNGPMALYCVGMGLG